VVSSLKRERTDISVPRAATLSMIAIILVFYFHSTREPMRKSDSSASNVCQSDDVKKRGFSYGATGRWNLSLTMRVGPVILVRAFERS